jgi:hypothetical protein
MRLIAVCGKKFIRQSLASPLSANSKWAFSSARSYSTVTLLARFLGLSTSVPRATAV